MPNIRPICSSQWCLLKSSAAQSLELYLLTLVKRQTPSVQVFNRVGSGMLSFQYIFLSTNIICPIVVSYFPEVFLLVCTHVQSVLELSVLGLGSV